MKKYEGRIVFNEARGTFNLCWREGEKKPSKKLGTPATLPTERDRIRAAERFWKQYKSAEVTVRMVYDWYWEDRTPEHERTADNYRFWLDHYVLPKWGKNLMTDLESHPVETWLKKELQHLAPGSRRLIREVIRNLWATAMRRNGAWPLNPHGINPMVYVQVPKASVAVRPSHSMTVEEFDRWINRLGEPYLLIALIQISFALRISECLGLKWTVVDWERSTITVLRSFAKGKGFERVKNKNSRKRLKLPAVLIEWLKAWQERSLANAEDWIFPSNYGGDRGKPISDDTVRRQYRRAAKEAGIKLDGERLSTHAMRHTAALWMDHILNLSKEARRDGMRHGSFGQTEDYGIVEDIAPEAAEAHRQLAELAVSRIRKVISGDFRVV